MRKNIIAGNWKMNKSISEAVDYVRKFIPLLSKEKTTEVVICPPFTSLWHTMRECINTPLLVGAQNVFWEESGSFTGEISPLMLKEIGISYCIIGHSERRTLFSETDEDINNKTAAVLAHNIKPIVCIGETIEERDKGNTFAVCEEQITNALKKIKSEDICKLVVAYEPVWAIGTGRNASPEEAQEAAAFIRKTISKLFGQNAAQNVRIQYGGSVKPENIAFFMKEKDIDGALVGGASLDPEGFNQIINNSYS